MSQNSAGVFLDRPGLYIGLAVLHIFLLIPLQNDTLANSTVGKIFGVLVGICFGKAVLPGTWVPSLGTELISFLNPGTIIGLIIGFKDIQQRADLTRTTFPALLLSIPLIVILFIPQGVWFTVPFGGFLLLSVPYSLIGGIIGWKIREKRSSALTNGLTGRRPG